MSSLSTMETRKVRDDGDNGGGGGGDDDASLQLYEDRKRHSPLLVRLFACSFVSSFDP